MSLIVYNNGIKGISAPVSIEDVRQALGASSSDLGTLCGHSNINIWSKNKPVPYNSLFENNGGKGYAPVEADWYRKYGIKRQTFIIPAQGKICGTNTKQTIIASNGKPIYIETTTDLTQMYYNGYWRHLPPGSMIDGTYGSPCRLTDFHGYTTDKRYWEMSGGIKRGICEPYLRLRWDIDGVFKATVGMMLSNESKISQRGLLTFNDLYGGNDNLYYGYMLISSGLINPKNFSSDRPVKSEAIVMMKKFASGETAGSQVEFVTNAINVKEFNLTMRLAWTPVLGYPVQEGMQVCSVILPDGFECFHPTSYHGLEGNTTDPATIREIHVRVDRRQNTNGQWEMHIGQIEVQTKSGGSVCIGQVVVKRTDTHGSIITGLFGSVLDPLQGSYNNYETKRMDNDGDYDVIQQDPQKYYVELFLYTDTGSQYWVNTLTGGGGTVSLTKL